ncbi:MAG: DUF502 domain-containing protein [Candidatus Omnitrophica bacterium]|nr:DUF502 domain-containing protein [Candidatus Omnitrophota bacterium]
MSKTIGGRLRRYFLAGVLTILPLFISLYILYIVFSFTDGILGSLINVYFKRHFGVYIPGLGLILFLLIILFTGIVSTHFLGKGFHRFLDRAMGRFPILGSIYPLIKQTFAFLFSENEMAFKKAVLVEYPCKGTWSIGFITNESFKEAREKTNQELLNIFIPLAPSPATGFIALIPSKDVIILNVGIKEAMKLVVSVGLLNPENLPVENKDKV